MWNTVLFDLDGTITDSGEGITRSVQYALSEGFGIEVEDLHELDCFVGPPLKEMFMGYAGLTEEEADRAIALYRERYTDRGMFENSVYEGIPELLGKLREEGFVLAVSSSKPTVFCRTILEHFGLSEYFDLIEGSELDGRNARKSEVIDEVAEKLGMADRKDEMAIVGDRSYDVRGAKEAGIGSIGVSWGYGPREELEAEDPDCICDSTVELENVLIGQKRDGGLRAMSGPVYRPDGREGRTGVRDLRLTGSAEPYDGRVRMRVWRCLYPLLIDVAMSFSVSVLCGILIAFFVGIGGGSIDPETAIRRHAVLVTAITDAAMIPVFLYLFRNDENRRRRNGTAAYRIPVRQKMTAQRVALCALLAMFVSGVLELVVAVIASGDAEYEAVAELIAAPGLGLKVIAIAVIGPIMEELLFRGLVYRRIRDYAGVGAACVLSAVTFGIAHGNLTQGIYAFMVGIILALLYEHYGGLWAPIAAHMGNNLFAVLTESFSDVIPETFYLMYYIFSFVITAAAVFCILRRKRSPNVI